jgi:very-short-patch-repair endonuclease
VERDARQAPTEPNASGARSTAVRRSVVGLRTMRPQRYRRAVAVSGDDDILRRLARHQWVRLHGTPRVTVLAGQRRARRFWTQWSQFYGVESAPLDADADFGAGLANAIARASVEPCAPIAVIARQATIARWQANAADRLRAIVAEGLLAIPEPADAEASVDIDARSAAEAALFEALESTAATTGLFELNARLAVRFGSDAAEVDLLARRERIAIEIDGYHHFTDADAYRRDRQKDVLLQTQGLFVVRVLAQDVMREPQAAVRTICQVLAQRAREAR